MPQPLRIFYSYSHADDAFRIRLEKHLKLLERQGQIAPWSDRKILPGEEWSRQIDERLERADVILFLVSADFFASEYCWGVEVKRAMERHLAGEALVVPLILRAYDWHTAPFAKLQALPPEGKAVELWPNQDEAWAEVAKALRRLIESRAGISAPTAGAAPSDPTRYLEALEAENSFVELRGMGAQVAEQMPLDRLYTRLSVGPGTEAGAGKADGKGSPSREMVELRGGFERGLGLPEVLRTHRHAVLVGDPGSGKTTFLRFAVQVLASALLSGQPERVARELGIEGEVPFPIFLRLRRFAEFLSGNDDPTLPHDAPEHLLRFLDFFLRGQGFGLAEGYLRSRLEAGGCFLLLDGLDEVPGPDRERVAAIVEKLVVQHRGRNRHLLSCRTRAYQGRRRLGTVPSFRLAAFEPGQVAEFVRAWSRALFRVPPEDGAGEAARQAETYRDELQQAIDAHPDVGPLTESP